MEANLKFNLDNPDDKRAHLRAIKSLDMALALWHIEANMRKKLEEKVDLWQEVCTPEMVIDAFVTELRNIYDEYRIDPDELVE